MTFNSKLTEQAIELRKQAEKIATEKAIHSPDTIAALSTTEIQKLLHELQVHQIELEMQNDELRRTQKELDATRDRYFNLYDLAPTGYLTLSEKGIILETNITAATLLEAAKGAMVKQPLSNFILKEDQDIYYLFRKQLLEIGGTQSCELRMVKKDGSDFWMNLTATAAQDADVATVCRIAMTDITDRKRAEESGYFKSALLEAQLASSIDGILIVNTQGKKILQNQRTVELFKIPQYIADNDDDEIQVQYVKQMTKNPAKFIEKITHLYKHPDECSRDDVELRDGTVLERYSAPLVGKGGQPYGRIWMFHDITALKQTERALRESEKQYRYLFDLANEGLIMTTLAGQLYQVNQAFAEMHGHTVDELKHMDINDLDVLGERLQEDRADLIRRVQAGETVRFEVGHYHKDGHIFPITVTTSMIDIEGKQYYLSFNQDITERKQAEEILREKEQQFRDIFDNSAEAIFIFDIDGVIVSANPMANTMYGYEDKEMIGLSDKDIISPDYYHVSEDFKQQLACSGLYRGESVDVRSDGTTFNIEVRGSSFTQKGKPYVLAMVRDVTERKQAEEDLKNTKVKLQRLFDLTPDLICEADSASGYFTQLNPSWTKTLGFSVEELLSKPLFDFIHPDDIEATLAEVNRQLVGNETHHFVNRYRCKDGNYKWLSWESTPANEHGLLYAAAQDITESKQSEVRLQQAQKLESIGTLAGGIAHDFNNLLSPLLGFAELLKEDIPADSPMQSSIDEIISAALRSKDLVKQILAVSRRDEPDVKPIRLQPIVKEALSLLRASIPTTIDIQNDIDPQCGMVMADPTKIHQIIMNLATNAYHAMEDKGGRLDVALKQVAMTSEPDSLQILTPGNYALLTVSDTGAGIEKKILDKIFDPYFTTKGVGKGTGLGLSVVHGIVTSHKGIVDVSSVPGKGTKFSVYLPTMEHTTEHIIAENVGPDPVGTEQILLVDDETQIVRVEQQMLERLGYRVTSRASSKEALEVFKANPGGFDLVLTDMTMPNMTGIQLARELVSIRWDIPVIICTGFSTMLNDESMKSNGIKGVLRKPVVKSNMAHMVRKVLDEAKGSAQG